MKRLLSVITLITLGSVACSRAASPETSTNGFVSIYDGKTLSGWHVSAKTGHSRASTNRSGGKWVVEDGAIVGSQDIKGNGGLIITDGQYGLLFPYTYAQ